MNRHRPMAEPCTPHSEGRCGVIFVQERKISLNFCGGGQEEEEEVLGRYSTLIIGGIAATFSRVTVISRWEIFPLRFAFLDR